MEPENPAADWLRLPEGSRRLITRRLTAFWRRAFNQGSGIFLAGIFFLTCTAIAFRIYIAEEYRHGTEIRVAIEKTIGEEQEPNTETDLPPGVTAAVLAGANTLEKWTDCPSDTQDCLAIELTHRIFPVLAASVLSAGTANAVSEDVSRLLARLRLPATIGSEFRTRWESVAAAHVVELRTPSVTAIPECGRGSVEYARRTRELGPAGCLPAAAGVSSVHVPAQLRDPHTGRVSNRVAEAVAVSAVLDDTLGMALQVLPAGAWSDDPMSSQFVQAYFISLDNVLRIWSRRSNPVVEEFPPTRLWASKHYFDVFWEKNDREYVTRPYLDFGGNGLIRTRCDALERQDDRQLLGILCTDFTLPRIPLLKKINDGPLFYGNTVEIHRDAPQLVRFDLPENERRPSAQLEASLRSLVASQTDSLVKLRRQITRVPSAEGVSFLIPIGSRHRDDILYALLLTPRDVTSVPVITWSRVAWLSFGGLTLGLLLSGVVISDRTAELSRRLTLLRNLQVGVAQANNRDWILEANDRAEELFRRKLPKRRVARPSVNFSQLIDEWVIPIEPADDNYLGEPCGRGIRYSRIQEKRERGEASIYYARLRGAEPQWLRVSASPILFSEKTRSGSSDGQLGADFGVVDQVSKDLAGRLETIWQTSRRLSNDG